MSFTEDQKTTLRVVFITLSTLSVLCELFIIFSYVSIRKRTSVLYSQVIWLFTTDIICILTYFYSLKSNIPSEDLGCKILGFISELTYISSLFWTSIIAGTILYSIETGRKISSPRTKYTVLLHFIGYIYPFYLLFADKYGVFEGDGIQTCWIQTNNPVEIIIAFWIPIGICWLFNVYCYVRILIFVRRNLSEDTAKDFRVLLIFPIAQMVSNSGFVVYSLLETFGIESTFTLQIIHVLTRGSEGVLNVMAYGSSYSIRRDIYRAWCLKRRDKLFFGPIKQNPFLNLSETSVIM